MRDNQPLFVAARDIAKGEYISIGIRPDGAISVDPSVGTPCSQADAPRNTIEARREKMELAMYYLVLEMSRALQEIMDEHEQPEACKTINEKSTELINAFNILRMVKRANILGHCCEYCGNPATRHLGGRHWCEPCYQKWGKA